MSVENQPRSVSQAQQYEECGHRYYLRRVERVASRPAAWSHHGTAFHTACEAVERSGREMTADEAVALFSDEYGRLINQALADEPDLDRWLHACTGGAADDIEQRFERGREQTRRYVEWARESGPVIWKAPDGTAGLELAFETVIGGVVVRGYIDQLIAEPDGSVRVRDLKTGSTKSRFQLETYAVAVRQEYNVPVNSGDWYLAKDHRLSRTVKLSDVSSEDVGQRYAAMDAGVKREDFMPAPGFGCKFCDVSHACDFSRQRS
ncbi:RecB family exonuclease [Embleya hyalina]|uniref:Exonuclease RecB n=1 Tax=Embleya hyalina TaxID=516124 RepID=A0A401YZ35_9ACTN|nr:PD-(D/E)XK nuclease family protein [Embleya hyalina]GCD99848.1 exonuclease RecB [Embleya hyalina]